MAALLILDEPPAPAGCEGSLATGRGAEVTDALAAAPDDFTDPGLVFAGAQRERLQTTGGDLGALGRWQLCRMVALVHHWSLFVDSCWLYCKKILVLCQNPQGFALKKAAGGAGCGSGRH